MVGQERYEGREGRARGAGQRSEPRQPGLAQSALRPGRVSGRPAGQVDGLPGGLPAVEVGRQGEVRGGPGGWEGVGGRQGEARGGSSGERKDAFPKDDGYTQRRHWWQQASAGLNCVGPACRWESRSENCGGSATAALLQLQLVLVLIGLHRGTSYSVIQRRS
eukprot:scaffold1016_cov132-Isochrysis_galbana.AAC.4